MASFLQGYLVRVSVEQSSCPGLMGSSSKLCRIRRKTSRTISRHRVPCYRCSSSSMVSCSWSFASFAKLGPLLSPFFCRFSCHTCPHQLCASSLFSLFAFCFLYIFALDVCATTGVFSYFQMGSTYVRIQSIIIDDE